MVADGWSFLYNVLNAIFGALFPFPSRQMKLLWKCCGKIGSLFITCWVSVAVKKWSIYGKSAVNRYASLDTSFAWSTQRLFGLFDYWGCLIQHPCRWFVMPSRFPLSIPIYETFRTAAESPVVITHEAVHFGKQRRVYRCKGTNKWAKRKRKTCFFFAFSNESTLNKASGDRCRMAEGQFLDIYRNLFASYHLRFSLLLACSLEQLRSSLGAEW